MRKRGVEPLPLAGLDPKSSASANSATFAYDSRNGKQFDLQASFRFNTGLVKWPARLIVQGESINPLFFNTKAFWVSICDHGCGSFGFGGYQPPVNPVSYIRLPYENHKTYKIESAGGVWRACPPCARDVQMSLPMSHLRRREMSRPTLDDF